MGITMTERAFRIIQDWLMNFRLVWPIAKFSPRGSPVPQGTEAAKKSQVVKKGSSSMVCMFVVIVIPKN